VLALAGAAAAAARAALVVVMVVLLIVDVLVRMGHTVGVGMRMGVDSLVVIVVKMHGSASLMILVVLYRFLLIL